MVKPHSSCSNPSPAFRHPSLKVFRFRVRPEAAREYSPNSTTDKSADTYHSEQDTAEYFAIIIQPQMVVL